MSTNDHTGFLKHARVIAEDITETDSGEFECQTTIRRLANIVEEQDTRLAALAAPLSVERRPPTPFEEYWALSAIIPMEIDKPYEGLALHAWNACARTAVKVLQKNAGLFYPHRRGFSESLVALADLIQEEPEKTVAP